MKKTVYFLRGRICIFLICVFFHVFTLGNLFAVTEDGRPLREIQDENIHDEDISLFVPQSSFLFPDFFFQKASNSILTEKALEQELTQRYIAQYSNKNGIANLNAVLARASIYLPFIMEEVKKRGMPPELAYLPIIESGFQITARSRSGAAGLWQFMMNSIAPYNMKVNEYVDERRDFVKSTLGALQKLEDEYAKLGDWELTLAAYNTGLNGVQRLVKRTGINDYWELCRRKELRSETVNFVPRLLAAVYVVSQPRRFGLNVWLEKFEWEAVSLPRQVSLDMLADETGMDRGLLRRLNAELNHGISPVDSNYRLKVPLAKAEQIKELLARDDLPLIRYSYHVVRQGDTVWSMARHYGISVAMIEQQNSGISNRYLRLGETVIIPAFAALTVQPAASITASAQGFDGFHVVQKGETFWSLSRLYGVEAASIASANSMTINQILHEGKTLRVPIINQE